MNVVRGPSKRPAIRTRGNGLITEGIATGAWTTGAGGGGATSVEAGEPADGGGLARNGAGVGDGAGSGGGAVLSSDDATGEVAADTADAVPAAFVAVTANRKV